MSGRRQHVSGMTYKDIIVVTHFGGGRLQLQGEVVRAGVDKQTQAPLLHQSEIGGHRLLS